MSRHAAHEAEIGLRQLSTSAKPSPEEVKDWLRREVWSLPILDLRSAEDILGYDEHLHTDITDVR